MAFIFYDTAMVIMDDRLEIYLGSHKKYIKREDHELFFQSVSNSFEDRYHYLMTVDTFKPTDEPLVISCLDAILTTTKNNLMTFAPPANIDMIDKYIIVNFVEKYLLLNDNEDINKKLRDVCTKLITDDIDFFDNTVIINHFIAYGLTGFENIMTKVRSWHIVPSVNDFIKYAGYDDTYSAFHTDQVHDYLTIDVSRNLIQIPAPINKAILENKFVVSFYDRLHKIIQEKNVEFVRICPRENHPELYHCMDTYKVRSDLWVSKMIAAGTSKN